MICPFAEWKPAPSSNFGHDGKAKIGLVVHHMDGSMASADGWFRNPDSHTSAHFGVAYDGHLVQWVDTADVAYAQCQGNWQGWVSVENESNPDRPNDPPTAAQIATMGRLIAWLGTPAVPATSMYSGGVGYHRQFGGPCSEAWGQTACPGDGFIASIPAICAAAGAKPVPLVEGDEKIMVYISKKSDPAVGIFVTDGVFKRWVGPDEWAFARFVNPAVSVLPISDQWWSSLPTAKP